MSKKQQISLSPNAFSVNEKGEVVINNDQLANALLQTDATNPDHAESIRVAVSVG